MNKRLLMWLFRLAVLLALTVSAALLVDYQSFSPSYCGSGSGCETVRRSGYGYIPVAPLKTAIPIPWVGLLGFALLFGASLLKDSRRRRLYCQSLSAAGAFVAVGLILLQAFDIGRFCFLCVVVDVCAIAACALAFLQNRKDFATGVAAESDAAPAEFALRRPAWIVLGLLAILLPFYYPKVKPKPPVPPQVAAHYQAGKINVVEFADFECPFCRALHGRLKALLSPYGERVNFVRLHMPLERHPQARGAAKLAICAEKQGRGEAMADHLFEAEDLSMNAVATHAKDLEVDLEKLSSCVVHPDTESSLRKQARVLREAGFSGLPTTYIGNQVIVGAQPDPVFLDALDDAAKGDQGGGIPGPIYLALSVLAVGTVVWLGRARRAPHGATQV